MKEIYEKISIDIAILENEDVITTSSINDNPTIPDGLSDHDNSFIDWGFLE